MLTEKLTIDEVIAHCNRHTQRIEKRLGKEQLEKMPIEDFDILKEYWEHRQVAAWLEQLKEYQQLEEQEGLIVLPCKVGDKVYVKLAPHCDLPYAEAEVRDFSYFLSCGFCIVVTSKHFDKQHIPFTEFGKTVFHTEEQAKRKQED